MDSEFLYELKSITREDMAIDGVLGSRGNAPTPDKIEGNFFRRDPLIGINTHELEANYAGFHSHTHFELVYVVTGSCVQTLDDGRVYTLKKGNFCILNPLARHSLVISEPGDNILVMAIKPALFNAAFFSFFENGNEISEFFINYMMSVNENTYLLFLNDYDIETDRIIEQIISAWLRLGPFHTTELKCQLILLFARLLQNAVPRQQSEGAARLSEIIGYMSDRISSVTLQSTAEHFGFHPNYLSAYIKKQCGRNFSEILLELRLVQAKYYLTSTDLAISSIANLLGYQDQPSFNAMFRKNTGMTPTEFRRNNSVLQEGPSDT